MKQHDSGMNSMQSPHSKWGAKGYKLLGLMSVIYRPTCKLNGDDSIAVFANLIFFNLLPSLIS